MAVVGGRPKALENQVTDAERAPQRNQRQIPVRMRAVRFVGNNRTERMANEHSGAGPDDALHTRLDLRPH